MITLAVDMSSGDLGSKAALEGVRLFQEKHPNEVNFLLVGKKEELEGAQGEIVDAKEVMPMEAGVLDALRNKESSMFKAVNSVKEKKADGVISCGGTGAYRRILNLRDGVAPQDPRRRTRLLGRPFPHPHQGEEGRHFGCRGQ